MGTMQKLMVLVLVLLAVAAAIYLMPPEAQAPDRLPASEMAAQAAEQSTEVVGMTSPASIPSPAPTTSTMSADGMKSPSPESPAAEVEDSTSTPGNGIPAGALPPQEEPRESPQPSGIFSTPGTKADSSPVWPDGREPSWPMPPRPKPEPGSVSGLTYEAQAVRADVNVLDGGHLRLAVLEELVSEARISLARNEIMFAAKYGLELRLLREKRYRFEGNRFVEMPRDAR